MDIPTLWWLAAGAMVVAELLSGTFYLLMFALGLAAAALAAHAGLGITAQIVTAAVVGLAAVLAWHRQRLARREPTARAQRSVLLDIGEELQIDRWEADGCAHVMYRGAQWQAVLKGGGSGIPGRYRVTELLGNRLVVEKV